jgi:hypothetical protein
MAIARINGGMLQNTLERNGVNIQIDSALYVDVTNNRIGVNNTSPAYTLDITGNAHLGNLYILGNTISTQTGYKLNIGNIANINIAGGSNNYILSTDGAGNLSFIDAANLPAISAISLMRSAWTGMANEPNAITTISDLATDRMNIFFI